MSMPYDAVPVDSDGSKLRPSPSIDAGPLGRLSRVASTPLARTTPTSVITTKTTIQPISLGIPNSPSFFVSRRPTKSRCVKKCGASELCGSCCTAGFHKSSSSVHFSRTVQRLAAEGLVSL